MTNIINEIINLGFIEQSIEEIGNSCKFLFYKKRLSKNNSCTILLERLSGLVSVEIHDENNPLKNKSHMEIYSGLFEKMNKNMIQLTDITDELADRLFNNDDTGIITIMGLKGGMFKSPLGNEFIYYDIDGFNFLKLFGKKRKQSQNDTSE